MSTLINDPTVQPEIDAIIARRQEIGADAHDEVWEGVYFMSPLANNEHQYFVGRLNTILDYVVGLAELGDVRPGVNVSDREENWRENYRVPDVAVFLRDTTARDCGTFWLGGPDFLVEIASQGDRSHEKLPFYHQVGVQEVLIVNRRPWQLEHYRRDGEQLKEVSVGSVQNKAVIGSAVVPLTFQLVIGEDRPQIEVKHVVNNEEKQSWIV